MTEVVPYEPYGAWSSFEYDESQRSYNGMKIDPNDYLRARKIFFKDGSVEESIVAYVHKDRKGLYEVHKGPTGDWYVCDYITYIWPDIDIDTTRQYALSKNNIE